MASAMTPVRKHAAHHTARGVDIDPDTGAIVDPNTGETFIDNKALLDSGATVTQNIVVLAATTTITGSNGDDSLPGTAGDDLILGLDGNDTLDGGSGNDTLIGGAGADSLIGGFGADTASYAGSTAGGVVANLGTGTGLGGDAAGDTYNGIDNLIGTDFADTLTGNLGANSIDSGAGDDTLDGGASPDVLIGGMGNDTYIVDAQNVGLSGNNITAFSGDTVIENANGGTDLVLANTFYALSANVENAQVISTSATLLVGNALDNSLTGNIGNDVLVGGGGADVLNGGSGGADTASYITAIASVTASLDPTATIAGVPVVISGDAVGDTYNSIENLTGSHFADTLVGDAGANVLDGDVGADTLVGGQSNDIYVADNVGDVVIEAAGEGTDEVRTTLSNYTLGPNVENLTLTSGNSVVGIGNELDNVIKSGFFGGDTLIGGAGNDTLDGGGATFGPTGDTLIGGIGDDTYIVRTAADVFIENSGEGTDEVQTALTSYTLALGNNVENLTYTGINTTFRGTGNELNNVIKGGNANDTLDGGAGVDTLIGGLGSDTYVVDNNDDVIVEDAGEGIDTALVNTNHYILWDNVENAVAQLNTGVTLVGNSLTNTLTGGAGNDSLDASGTFFTPRLGEPVGDQYALVDKLIGGAGNDFYVIANSDDVIIENANEGIDMVLVDAASYTLAANVEDAEVGLFTDATLVGNGLANWLRGGSLNDTLNGGAGNDTLDGFDGTDTLIGGSGSDTFVFGITISDPTHSLGAQCGTQTIMDFNAGGEQDFIKIRHGLVSSAQEALNDAKQVGSNVVITLPTNFITNDANVITLKNFSLANLHASDFIIDRDATLFGGAGADTLAGGAGDDLMFGGAGDDMLNGRSGNDQITGGAGSDTFVFGLTPAANGTQGFDWDIITDFTPGQDHIQINDGLFASASAVLAAAKQLDFGGVQIALDPLNSILLQGVSLTSLSASDFVIGPAIPIMADAVAMLTGSSGSDMLTGANADVMLDGGAGNDTLSGGAGNDTLDGGVGADMLIGGDGDDVYVVENTGDVVLEVGTGTDEIRTTLTSYSLAATGGVENLTFAGTSGNFLGSGNALTNVITGGSGNDTLDGGTGVDTLIGGQGNDTYLVDNASDVVTEASGAGTDEIRTALASYSLAALANLENLTFTGTTGNFVGTGNALDNVITGGSGNDILDGGSGNDVLIGGSGGDMLIGGDGTDTVSYATAKAGVIANLASGGTGGDAAGDTYNSIENLIGSAYDDILTGNSFATQLIGGAGNDTLISTSGGNVLFVGGVGADRLIGSGTFNTASYVDASAGVIANLASGGTGGDAAGDTYVSIQNLTGSNFDDVLTGNAGTNVINGGAGNDTLIGGAGGDFLFGGGGSNTASYATAAAGVVASLVSGGMVGDAAGDTYNSIQNLTGSDFNDVLIGNASSFNILQGGLGNDTLVGGGGADFLIGGAGSDTASYVNATTDLIVSLVATNTNTGEAQGDFFVDIENLTGSSHNDMLTGDGGSNVLDGGIGNDTLIGGGGNDTLIGGDGNDTFIFGAGFGHDTATDFTSGQDLIQIKDGLFADANAALAAATQTGGNVTITVDASNSIVLQNYNRGNLHASDFVIVSALSGSMLTSSFTSVGDTNSQPQADSGLAQLVQAMASYPAADAGSDPMAFIAQLPCDLQNAIAAAQHS